MATQPDPNWPRWILQSIINHYKVNVVDPNSVAFLVDGVDLRDDVWMNEPDRVELRINGPDTHELSNNCWRIWVQINLFFTSMMGQENTNRYGLENLVGLFLSETDVTAIPIYRYGNGPDDDGTLVGCLSPRTDMRDAVRTVSFGQLSPEDLVKQAQIDGRFQMYLSI